MPTIYCAEDQKMVLGLSCPQVQVGTRIERGAPSAMRHSPRLLLRPQKVAARSFRGCSRVARLVRQVSGFSGVKTAGWCGDRKSTRLNSSHVAISYAVFCLKKKKISDNNNVNSRC